MCDAELIDRGRARGIIGGGLRPGTATGEQAVVLAFLGKIRGYTWNKLIARRIIELTPFPPIKMHTDFSAMITALSLCRKVAMVDQVLYRHHANPGSLSRGKLNDVRALRTCLETGLMLAEKMPLMQSYPGIVSFFEAWFFLIPVASATASGTAGEPLEMGYLDESKARLIGSGLSGILRFSLPVWIRTIGVIFLGRAYGILYRFLSRGRALVWNLPRIIWAK